jgi:hypothetical protein
MQECSTSVYLGTVLTKLRYVQKWIFGEFSNYYGLSVFSRVTWRSLTWDTSPRSDPSTIGYNSDDFRSDRKPGS